MSSSQQSVGPCWWLVTFFYFRVPTSGYKAARLLSGCWSSRDLSLAENRGRFPSSRYLAGGTPPSCCTAAAGVVLKTGKTARSSVKIVLSIISMRAIDSCRVTIPFVVGRSRPGHQTSDPCVATGLTTVSMTLTRSLGAALMCTKLRRRICNPCVLVVKDSRLHKKYTPTNKHQSTSVQEKTT